MNQNAAIRAVIDSYCYFKSGRVGEFEDNGEANDTSSSTEVRTLKELLIKEIEGGSRMVFGEIISDKDPDEAKEVKPVNGKFKDCVLKCPHVTHGEEKPTNEEVGDAAI